MFSDMESPEMYDSSSSDDSKKSSPLAVKKNIGCFGYSGEPNAELSQLDNNELSFDLQRLLDGNLDGNLFNDILIEKSGGIPKDSVSLTPIHFNNNNRANVTLNALNYIPGAVHSNSTYNPLVKKEPPEESSGQEGLSPASSTASSASSSSSTAFPSPPSINRSYAPVLPGSVNQVHNGFSNYSPGGLPGCDSALFKNAIKKCHKKNVNKLSDEYRRRRERNNIAVRKSREKAKVRTKETEDRVKLLARDNDKLRRQIDVLSRELNWLKNVYPKLGVIPEHLQREIAKQLETFQHHAGL